MKLLLGKNKTLAKSKIRSILLNNKNKVFHNDLIVKLIKNFHPSQKASKCERLFFGKCLHHPINNDEEVLQIVENDGDKKSISWNKCIDVVYAKTTKNKSNDLSDLKEALRAAIHNTSRMDFIVSSNIKRIGGCLIGDCSKCKRKNIIIEIDHDKTPFSTIAHEFLASENETPATFKISTIHELADVETKKRWIAFHDKRATFAILCKRCNASKGNK